MNGITIVVTADTEQAGQSLETFAGSGAAQLQRLRESSVLLRDTIRGTSEVMLLMGGPHSQEMFLGLQLVRSGMMSARAAALAFHTSIMGVIGTMVEFVPAIGAAALAWGAFHSILSQPDPLSSYVVKQNEALKEQVEWLKMVQQLHKSGALTAGQAARDSDLNAGSFQDLMAKGLVVPSKEGAKSTALSAAFADFSNVLDKLNESGLDETGRKLQEINARFADMKDVAVAAGKILVQTGQKTQQQYQEIINQIDEAKSKAEDKALADVASKTFAENQQKAEAAFAKGQEAFHKMVEQENQDLDQRLNLQAAQAGKTREQIYQQEFAERSDLLTRQLFAGEISETDYTKAVEEAQTKRLEGLRREQEEARKLDELKQRMANQEANASRRQLVNPLLAAFGGGAENTQSQLGAINNQIASVMAQMQKQTEATFQPQSLEQQLENLQKRNELEEQLNKLLDDQARAQAAVDNARVEGVKNMFGNMATAAKAFGQEGLAVYKGFAIAQATIDTAKAAIAAYSSVVGIPYIGPVLAVAAAAAAVAAGAAQIGEIESAQAREAGGPVTAGQLYMTGERGRELFTPTVDGHIFNAGETAQILGSAGNSGAGSAAINHKTELHLATFGGEADAKRWADSNEGETWFLNMMNKHAYRYNA